MNRVASTGRTGLTRGALTLVLAAAVAACGSSTDPGPSGGGDTMTASIDGASFDAVTVQVRQGAPDTISFVGTTATTSSPVTQVSIALTDVTGPGTFTVDASAFPTNLALVTVTSAGVPSQWSTTQAAGPGSVTITSLTGNRATGTFQFVAEADPGTAATGQVSVTSGTFSISF